ncbi:dihydrofolate reductase domain-containing protein [Rhizoctonia solani]|uniref:Dihydrofolate reductase n=1 Tax=Rhizoctonia solani TaxID=456999 RepID=A0A8H8NWJ4_9AGAM|nr:dihydrofolate reductase domain-containing protein [Rhizoctonia solani]QRW19412.1 dihydrofolate reductase domain-containing protein [Rhizoctonia solani]
MSSSLPQLTLVVAATLSNGIGTKGNLPWRLSREMAYFAKVTREGGPRSSSPNTVIMGRKTWESIKPQYRPLKGRLNVVISSSITSVLGQQNVTFEIRDDLAPLSASEHPALLASSLDNSLSSMEAGNVFVIGGASIYAQALEHPATTRILLTRILEPAYEECDVFFPELKADEWTQAEHTDLEKWVGFEVAKGVQEEKGIKYEFQMWVKKQDSSP